MEASAVEGHQIGLGMGLAVAHVAAGDEAVGAEIAGIVRLEAVASHIAALRPHRAWAALPRIG